MSEKITYYDITDALLESGDPFRPDGVERPEGWRVDAIVRRARNLAAYSHPDFVDLSSGGQSQREVPPLNLARIFGVLFRMAGRTDHRGQIMNSIPLTEGVVEEAYDLLCPLPSFEQDES